MLSNNSTIFTLNFFDINRYLNKLYVEVEEKRFSNDSFCILWNEN